MKLVESKPLKRGGKGAVSVFYRFLTPVNFFLIYFYIFILFFIFFYYFFIIIIFFFFGGGVYGGGQSESMGVK